MKSIKVLAAVALASSIIIGCKEEDHFGIDSSKPAPKEFTYDEDNSSETSISVYWDDASMIDAGATSATVQLTTELNNGDVYDNSVTHTIVYNDEKVKVKNATTFTGLKKFSQYYIRVRANYPRSVFSDWVYITQDNEPVQLVLGYGFVKPDFIGIPNFSATATADAINLTWDPCVNAVKYIIEYKTASGSEWTSAETEETTFKITGLSDKTVYEVRAKSINKDGNESEYSEVKKITTLEKAAFPKDIATADEFVALFAGKELTTADATSLVNITADIDLSGKTIKTCATFPGILNGNKHSIKNWKSSTPLFTEVGSVKDLTIDASCSFTPTELEFGIIAVRNIGELTNVTNKANITMSAENFDNSVIYGGIVAEGLANITDCHNTGKITVTSKAGFKGVAVGGVAGYLSAAMKDCSNEGEIIVSGGFFNGGTDIVNIKNCAPSVGGLVGIGGNTETSEFSIKSCTNKGKVSLMNTSIEALTIDARRQNLGGIVGGSNGNVEKCKNQGEIIARHATSNGSTVSNKECIIMVGGISGSDYYADNKQNKSNIIECTNEGNINVFTNASKSNSAAGGIVGWPGIENTTQTVVTKGCVNSGAVTVSGTGKVRTGGIQGGSGNIENCTNSGDITIESGADNVCVVGGLAGFHSQNHFIRNSENTGSVSAKCGVSGIGGLIGNHGNVENTVLEGCSFKGSVNGGTEENSGIIVGYLNGSTKKVTFGTSDAPVKIISGTINGTTLDSGNYTNHMHGSTNYKEGTHIFNVVFGK